MNIKRIALTIVAVAAVALAGASTTLATKPDPGHKVTICHATPPDTAANGWISITVDIASTGYQHSGHQSEHDADIIPPYHYVAVDGTVFDYAGKNMDTVFSGVTGTAILESGCAIPGATATPVVTPTPSATPVVTPTPSATPVVTPTPSATPVATPSNPIPSLPGKVHVSAPPTDTEFVAATGTGPSGFLFIISLLSGIAGGALVLTRKRA